jgi:hypothetical protein
MRFGLALMAVMFFMMFVQILVVGPNYEYFIGIALFGGGALFAMYRLKDHRPQLEINAFGYSQYGRVKKTMYWKNVTSIKFDIIGRRTKVLAVKTESTRDNIVLAHVAIDPEELYDIFYHLSELPDEEREGFVRYVKGERAKRGLF